MKIGDLVKFTRWSKNSGLMAKVVKVEEDGVLVEDIHNKPRIILQNDQLVTKAKVFYKYSEYLKLVSRGQESENN